MNRFPSHDREEVLSIVFKALQKTVIGLGLSVSEEQLAIMSNDILESYKTDSIEDVIECLKKGRTGAYGYGHNDRKNFNMLVVRDWMSQHLDKKYQARERIHDNRKDSTQYAHVDYETYKARLEEERLQPDRKHSSLNTLTPEERKKRVEQLLKDNDL